mgnify:CR=1 FL=1
MDKANIINAIKKAREVSPKRNFKQSFDLIINLQEIDAKKAEGKVDLFLSVPHPVSKQTKICALVEEGLQTQAKALFEKVILKQEFPNYSSKKMLKELVNSYDYFVTQANLMGQVATTFGKTLGPKAKMPNPKAGCVVPPLSNLEPIKERLKKTIHAVTKNEPIIKVKIGYEEMTDEQVQENITSLYNSLIHSLPQEKNNIKSLILKTTMGPPVKITDKGPELKIIENKKQTKTK